MRLMKSCGRFARLCLTMLATAYVTVHAQAAELKVAILKTANGLSMQHAIDAGYFKEEGVNVQIITLNNGPAVTSAIVSQSADIGFAAAPVILSARANGQPVRFFSVLAVEAFPEKYGVWLDTAAASPVKSVQDLKGRTVAINAAGGQCEMQLRTQLRSAGLGWNDVKILVLPFPQIPAALQLGNADVACTVEPFHAVTRLEPAIKSRSVAQGTTPDMKEGYALVVDGFFAREDWLEQNKDTAQRFARAIRKANQDIMKDKSIITKLMERDLRIAPDVAAATKINLDTRDGSGLEKDFQAVIDLMTAADMLSKPVAAADVVYLTD